MSSYRTGVRICYLSLCLPRKWWVAYVLKVNIENGETLLQSSATSHLFQYPKMVIVTIQIHNVFVMREVHVMCKLWII